MKAALYINSLGGGDYEVCLVDEERHAQINAALDALPQDCSHGDSVEAVGYLLAELKDAARLHGQYPDLYPDVQRGTVLARCFTQDFVLENVSWPEVQIIAGVSVPE